MSLPFLPFLPFLPLLPYPHDYNHPMKAIVVRDFGAPDVLKLEELPDPVAGPGQVVIRVKAAGVNPVDTYIRSGVRPSEPGFATRHK